MKASLLFMLLVPASVSAQDQWKNVYTESAWTDRDRWQRPGDLIRHLALKPGSKVADIGCHEGYLTVKLSAAVGPHGKVYSVDVEQKKLDQLNRNLIKLNITNVIPIKGEYDNPLLPVNSLDGVIILDTYHEMTHPDQILQHIKAALKPSGRLVLCEPIASERRDATRTDQEQKHELAIHFALQDLKKAGFVITRQQDPMVDRTQVKGDKMWLIVAKK